MTLTKIIYSADMKEAGAQIQTEITAAETRGESLLQIVHNLPKREGTDIETFLFFRDSTTAGGINNDIARNV